MANSPDEIRETMEQLKAVSDEALNQMITDGAICGYCSECSANNENHDFTLDCNALISCAAKEVIRRLTEGQRSEPVIQQTADMLSFGRTVQFMRDRGHKRCYMCGSSLTGGGDNND